VTNQPHQYNQKITFKHNHSNCNSTASTLLQLPFVLSVLFLETVQLNTPLIPSFTLAIPIKYGLAIYRLSSIIYQDNINFFLHVSSTMTHGTFVTVMTMFNSRSYLVTPVTLQLSGSTPVAHYYSGHSCADTPLLSTTLGLSSIQSLPHFHIKPSLSWVLHVLDISHTLYHFHWTWFILPKPNFILPRPDFIFTRPDLVLTPVSAIRLFTCHCMY